MFPIQCNCDHEIPYYYSFFGIYYICVVYIYMNLKNIPMMHFVFQPLLQRQFNACHERQ